MSKMAKCFSCKKVVEREGNTCAGCRNVVCVKCALKYGHIAGGLHGHAAQQSVRATGRLVRRKKVSSKKVSRVGSTSA